MAKLFKSGDRVVLRDKGSPVYLVLGDGVISKAPFPFLNVPDKYIIEEDGFPNDPDRRMTVTEEDILLADEVEL